MPVLDKEPSVWPEDLLGGHAFRHGSARWYACHVRPRAEKAVARRLRRQEIAFFLPQHERRKRYQGRLVCSYLPLFPGYVFILADDQELAQASEFKEVVRNLTVDDQDQIERELRDIEILLRSGRPVTREERLRPGAMARIVKGPLTGLSGRVLKNRKGVKLVLQVHLLQQGVSIEVDSTIIEAI